MSKNELTPLEALENIKCDILDDNFKNKQVKVLLKELNIVKIALIDNECYKKQIAYLEDLCEKHYDEMERDSKKLKALEIITSISKQTTHFRLIQRNMGNDKFNYYLAIENCEYRLKDKEEFDLLKEVLL